MHLLHNFATQLLHSVNHLLSFRPLLEDVIVNEVGDPHQLLEGFPFEVENEFFIDESND